MSGIIAGASQFRKDEQGGLTVMSLFLFVLLLMISGLAVDLIRHEHERVRIQQVADTAVLAASRIDDTGDPEAVVREHFRAARLDYALDDVIVGGDANTRIVKVMTNNTMPTTFIKLLGINTLNASGGSIAEQTALDVEISMVLDISSSMWGNQRLQRLKDAVENFATDVIPLDTTASASDISVNIVPYSLSVNPGILANYMNIDGKHTFGNCVWFENSDFNDLGLSPGQTYERYTHMADGSSGYEVDGTVDLPMCPDHEISPFLTERQDVIDAVDALTGWDGTGIDIGVKWGLALLDPSLRSDVTSMISDGLVDGRMTGRPYNYGTSKKFLIVMSDGENDSQRDLHAEFREGPSLIWQDPATGNYSVLIEDGRAGNGPPQTNDTVSRWYHESSGQIHGYPDMAGASGATDWTVVEAGMVNLTWPGVFNIVTTNDLYDRFFQTADSAGYLTVEEENRYRQPIDFNRISDTDTNQRLADLCADAIAEGVEVFAISFDPPSQLAEDTLANCASGPGHFFPVEGTEISSAFDTIGGYIMDVRLTQ